MNLWCLRSGLFLTLALACRGQTADPTRELMKRGIANYERSSANFRNFFFDRLTVTRQFEATGQVREEHRNLIRREPFEGIPVTRLVERDGKPLPAEEKAKADANIRRARAEYAALSATDKAKRDAEAARPSREIEFLREMPEALDYEYVDSQWEGPREIMHFKMAPRRGYRPRNLQAKVFEKVRGEIWIDKTQNEMQKLDAEVFDTVSVGGILAKIEKGTHFLIERMPVQDGFWLPKLIRIKFGTKIMMVKSIRQESETTYSGYRPIPPAPGKAAAAP
ncbi:MAG: hypothetical protein NTZ56_10955 [Acidobacteria bacterium]|nr:hypothetical protein [Acidobacteriota bacterium]